MRDGRVAQYVLIIFPYITPITTSDIILFYHDIPYNIKR